MTIVLEGGQVIIPIPKGVLVMTRAQFIEALRRGKSYRRRQALQARHQETASAGVSGDRPLTPPGAGVPPSAVPHVKGHPPGL